MALFLVMFMGTLMKMMVVLFVSSLAMTYQMLISWCILRCSVMVDSRYSVMVHIEVLSDGQ